MITECPSCHAIIVVQSHAPRGQGMQQAKKLKLLNQNLQSIGVAISESEEPLTIGEIRKILFESGVKRTHGQWNQSLVQVDVSRLVGLGLVTMLKRKRKKTVLLHETQTKRMVQ